MEKTITKISVCWLRRDLRLEDNAALYHALKSGFPVLLFFVFDIYILDKLPNRKDSRVEFIHEQLEKINKVLHSKGSSLVVLHSTPEKALRGLLMKYEVQQVYANHDYEPYASERDEHIKSLLKEKGINFFTFKDQVIYEKKEVMKPDATPYTVFTPYSRVWKEKLFNDSLPELPSEDFLNNFLKMPPKELLSLSEIGFEASGVKIPETELSEELIKNYDQTRDLPALEGTSRLGVHLRFGTISIRQVVKTALKLNETFLNELIWREFFMMILYHFPEVTHHNFRRKYDRIQWRNNEKEFDLWCKGETGYLLVDAGMKQLNETGWMHNRVRMIVAGFLTKHLLIDWRWGEAYFAEKLLDYELASNNGNWQWAAGTGCDSAPYFRIFNPHLQLEKFDPELKYVKTWLPDFDTRNCPPVVDHSFARQRALQTYKQALNK
ncbi:cryptochrome/photolyase family protein [Salinimicrobium flavum]|uniref:Cryptochrome/photolyase family protein n=1 Tax=Salinimicrobium flavum TaxID=1737065 RepID=A0ABW5J069_9FLAO